MNCLSRVGEQSSLHFLSVARSHAGLLVQIFHQVHNKANLVKCLEKKEMATRSRHLFYVNP